MSDCCPPVPPKKPHGDSCCHAPEAEPSCHTPKHSIDYLFWGSLLTVLVLYFVALLPGTASHAGHDGANLATLSRHTQEMVNTIWWGIVLGILMISLLMAIPREFVMSLLGTNNGIRGVMRATAAGLLLDLCSHGILMVGSKLYERGASIGQVMAFLIASPWNSFSLTLILFALIGVPWTLIFIALSMLVAIITGVLFDRLVDKGMLPANPHHKDLPVDFYFWPEARKALQKASFAPANLISLLAQGIRDSRMVLRWVLFGVLLASLIRTFVSTEYFMAYFGASLTGLLLTMIAATIIEVCSEGSTPIAADLVTRAQAPGNGFAFLMAGVATDYTEVMVVKETTSSWKIALFMPLLTLPQVFAVAWLLNQFA